MKRTIAIALLFVVAASAHALAQAKKVESMPAPKPSTPVFDAIKQLAGEWEGKMSDGTAAVTSYRVVSNHSAVMNVLGPGTEVEMVTMFHADGADLVATHYCAVGNQPRMVAKAPADPKRISFTFKDVTNVTSADEGHMVGLTLTIPDADHHTQEWTFRQAGQDRREVFQFTRNKR